MLKGPLSLRKQYIAVLKIVLVIYIASFGVFFLLEPGDLYYGRLKVMLIVMGGALVFTVVRIVQLKDSKDGRK
jgi:hypothetical protein